MTPVPPPAVELSADQARRIALRAQGFLGAPDRRAGVPGVLRHLGAVQLDTISVLARSHELIPYARLGSVGRRTVEEAYWSGGRTFEYLTYPTEAHGFLRAAPQLHFTRRLERFLDWYLL